MLANHAAAPVTGAWPCVSPKETKTHADARRSGDQVDAWSNLNLLLLPHARSQAVDQILRGFRDVVIQTNKNLRIVLLWNPLLV